ncbi:MAG: hypothetical protein C5B50_29710 [Verrucomicrobia bacterium]|nr:MAG: hypothetical protein C5B50_29710 [Verrucomicrobiota bacterium]
MVQSSKFKVQSPTARKGSRIEGRGASDLAKRLGVRQSSGALDFPSWPQKRSRCIGSALQDARATAVPIGKYRCGPSVSRFTFHVSRFTHRAFTIIEVLIAVALLTLVISAIYSTWTAILKGRKVGMDAAVVSQRARMAVRVLEDSLGSARAFDVHRQLHPEYYSFIMQGGRDGSLSFVARLAKSFPRSGKFGDLDVRRLTFTVESSHDGGGDELVLRQTPLLMEPDEDEAAHPLVLAKNVQDFELCFWDTKAQEWNCDDWKDNFTNSLPKLVRVTLKLADNAHSFRASEEIVRVINLPAQSVAPNWQAPIIPRVPPNAGGGGGAVPGQLPPGAVPPNYQPPPNYQQPPGFRPQ